MFTYKRLTGPVYIPTTAGTIYAKPASTTSYIRNILIYNGSAGSQSIQLYLVPTGGTAGVATCFWSVPVPPSETVTIEYSANPGMVLDKTGDALKAATTTASYVTISVFGAEES